MKTQIVLGTFFGDEGKGSTVQWLCKEAIDRGEKPLVIRYSGGSQAGHRIVCNGIEHVCSSFGGGTLLGVPTYLNENVMIDPISTKIEFEELQKKGITPKLYAHGEVSIITPYDVAANQSDAKVLSHGSCGEGIYHTFLRGMNNNKLPLKAAISAPKQALRFVRSYYGADLNDELDNKFIEALEWIKDFVSRSDLPPEGFNTYIFEGSQGLLLDMDCGFMPHCTPSRVGLNGIPQRFLKDAEVFMVMRPYLTRHGNGYNPARADMVREYFSMEEPTNLDDGFQGRFKHGLFDENLLRRTFDRHRIDNFKTEYNLNLNGVVTHLDCMIEDCIPFLNYKLEYVRYSEESFLEMVGRYFDKVYGSYSTKLSKKQFKLITK